MATVFPKLTDNLIAFIQAQPLFFVATAGADGRVNLSPKGMDSLRVIDPHTVAWLNLTGSGNETAVHVRENGRMTLMFCALEGPARILRLYGKATVLHPRDTEWPGAVSPFPTFAGARQVFRLAIECTQVSCGTGVPLMEKKGERDPTELLPFYADMPEGGLEAYWARKNRLSIDGRPTGIFEDEQHEDGKQDSN
jgi:Pyridoxamine 5'-phosphate oxidase